MKKCMYDYFGISMPDNNPVESVFENVVESKDTVPAILQAIYALDPVTLLPTGDIMCYMSSQTSSEIKQFIMENLMVDTSSQKLPSLPDGIDDETVFALQRHPDENVDSYRNRVSQFMTQQVNIRNMAIEYAKRQSSVEPK